jgi:6-phosphogluconolactonase (cycloisomerase 2 family)
MKFNYIRAVALAVLTGWLVTACGGGDSNSGPSHFTIGGSVSGLVGTGLVLQDNGGDNLPVSASGNFTFPTALAGGAAYAVTVKTQPTGPAQNCTVAGGTGTVSGADVTSVVVTCKTNGYTVGGSVTGLSGTGLVLEDNAGDDLPISASQAFTFSQTVGSGSTYAVTVKTQPTGPVQVCTVTNGTGKIAAANVTNVAVNCTTNTFAVGGTASGLVGTGLTVLMNGANPVAVGANGSFTAGNLNTGTQYAVTVGTQPTAPSQTCVVANGTGTVALAAVTNITVTCTTNNYAVGGTVSVTSGALGTGLQLQNGVTGAAIPIAAIGAQAYLSLPSGSTYNILVKTQPTAPSQTCVVSNGGGTVTNAAVTNVNVVCTTNLYTIGGTISGYTGSGLVLKDNGGDNLTVLTNSTTFTFATKLINGAAYAVTVGTQPQTPAQFCVVQGGTGNVTAANVTNVAISCRNEGTFAYTVDQASGTVSSFTIASNTGALGAVNSQNTPAATSAPAGVAYVVLPAGAGTYVYVADAGSADVSIYSADPTTGTLLALGSVPTGAPPPVPATAGAGSTPQSVAVDPSGKFLLVADNQNAYNDTATNPTGVIVVFAIDQTTGLLTQVSGSPFATALVPGAAPVYVTVDPSDLYAFAANQFAPNVAGFTFNNPVTSGNLTPTTQASAATGANPVWVTVDPLDRFVYVSNNSDGTISGYSLNAANGTLTPIAGSPFLLGVTVNPGAIAIDYTGRFLYVTDGANNQLFAFSIGATGALTTQLAGSPYTTQDAGATIGYGPFGIGIDPSGHLLYTGNSGDGSITEFTTNPVTGVPTQVNGSPMPTASGGTNAIAIE